MGRLSVALLTIALAVGTASVWPLYVGLAIVLLGSLVRAEVKQ